MVGSSTGTPEQLIRLERPEAGLSGVIAIHSSALGPAAGGCRLWRYPNDPSMMQDALRLAEGMSYKNALADLPLGGGKAVLRQPEGDFDRARLFRAFGEEVQKLHGAYVTAEDVGTGTVDMVEVASTCRYVSGLPQTHGRPGGDPSPFTARGVFLAMQVAVEMRLGRSLQGVRVAVQGLGNVGFRLCNLLEAAGAKLVVADPRADRTARAAAILGAVVVPVEAILAADVDVLAPCALGGVLDEDTIPSLRAKIACGGANNQLATPEDGARLQDRGILFAPDYVANAGGIINVAAEYLGWCEADVATRVAAIGPRMRAILNDAATRGVPPNLAADDRARAAIQGCKRRTEAA